MTLFYALIIVALYCLMESRNCSKRAAIWEALSDISHRIDVLEKKERM